VAKKQIYVVMIDDDYTIYNNLQELKEDWEGHDEAVEIYTVKLGKPTHQLIVTEVPATRLTTKIVPCV